LYILFGIILGAIIAWLLNKFIADKIENKDSKIAVNASAYIVLVILGLFFGLVCSIKPSLNNYLIGKIDTLEIAISKYFPDKQVMEYSINAHEYTEDIIQLQQSIREINRDSESFFEKIVYNAFIERVNKFIDDANRGINTLSSAIGNNQGDVTLKAILYYLKDLALKKITPFIVFFIILIITGVIIFISIYLCICHFLKKKI